jgi:hypothetical protein
MRIALWFDRCARAKGGSTLPMSGPITRRWYPTPWDDPQADAIDALDGAELMPVTPITSMSHERAA